MEHFSIPVDDVDRARAFYRDVFGFSYEPWDATRGELITGGTIDGDLHVRGPIAHPTITLSVDDLDGTLKTLIAHGGEQIGEVARLTESSTGRYVHVRDSEGNVLALYARDETGTVQTG